MKERPILFSGPMVRAILDGRKTQTRRVVKRTACTCGNPPGVSDHRMENIGANQWACASLGYTGEFVRCPFGAVGDRLWVRESFRHYGNRYSHGKAFGLVKYRADGTNADIESTQLPDFRPTNSYWYKERPSIHMPRWASRITLEITGVGVERLHGISEKDAKSEGMHADEIMEAVRHLPNPMPYSPYVGAFKQLWEKINGKKYPWASNPWVWCISFRRIDDAR